MGTSITEFTFAPEDLPNILKAMAYESEWDEDCPFPEDAIAGWPDSETYREVLGELLAVLERLDQNPQYMGIGEAVHKKEVLGYFGVSVRSPDEVKRLAEVMSLVPKGQIATMAAEDGVAHASSVEHSFDCLRTTFIDAAKLGHGHASFEA